MLVLAEPRYSVKELLPARVTACCPDMRLGLRRDQDYDLHSPSERILDRARYRRDGDGLVLDIDRFAGRNDGEQVLVKDRPLTTANVEGDAARACVTVGVAPGVNVTLDLDDARTTRIGEADRKRELVISLMTPPPVMERAFARLVPAL